VYMMDGDRFLMCSKKRPNNKTSNYLISMKAGDLSRGGRNYLGKLRANFVGTEFQVHTHKCTLLLFDFLEL
jgi:tubby and related proteins